MVVDYTRFEVSSSPSLPEGVVHRPVVTIRITGPNGNARIAALADTGSDETVLPASLAELIGLRLDDAMPIQAIAVGGHSISLRSGRVKLELADGKRTLAWRATVAFIACDNPEEEIALLGFAGFLEFFKATFDSETLQVTLETNGRFDKLQIAI